ncbi:MAG: alkaline phosphatase family protein [Candidatus Hermodarchaeota archaeon]
MSRSSLVDQVILILIDDVRASHLFDLISKGKLPNIAQVAEQGVSCQNCITSYPSITYPCYTNIVIGSYSGYYPIEGSGIPMYHWVGRTDPPSEGKKFPIIRHGGKGSHILKFNSDLGPNCQTIFEQAGDGNFLSSLNLFNRGSVLIPTIEYTTQSILKGVEDIYKDPKKIFSNKEVPRVTVAYIPKTDDLMHHKGFDHPEYITELIKCDKYIGSLIETLKNTGYFDSTAIGIISDHGNFKAEKMYDIEPFFEEKGLNQYLPRKGAGDFDAAIGSVGFFNFRGKDWHHHPTYNQLKEFVPSSLGSKKLNLFETLWKLPGVKLMYYRDDSNTPYKGVIYLEHREEKTGKKLKDIIEYEGHGINQKTKYIPDSKDFYKYSEHEESAYLLDNKGHSIDEWLKVTNQLDFPMIVDQVPRYFKNPRSCDIVTSTLGEYGFGYEHGKTVSNYPYSHDIGLKKSMTVPFIIGGSPNIPKLELSYCKTTDMVPTLLHLLGEKPHYSVVGKSVLDYS